MYSQADPAEGALAQVYDWVEDYADFAQAEGLQLLAYEGGQHLVGFNGVENNDAITNLFIEANRDPRLGDIYREYLETWFELGGGLFMNFSDITSSSKWGSWGTLEYLGQESSPKYNALLDLLDSATLSSASLG